MIRCKTKNNCKVYSKTGKPLSRGGLTRAAAERRLKQVEYFKHKRK